MLALVSRDKNGQEVVCVCSASLGGGGNTAVCSVLKFTSLSSASIAITYGNNGAKELHSFLV